MYKKIIKKRINAIRKMSPKYSYDALMSHFDGVPITHAFADNRAYAMLICRAYVINECLDKVPSARVLFDEGIVRSLMGILARISDDREREGMCDVVLSLLSEYPGERNAAMITAAPDECLRRQHERGAVLVSEEVPQVRFHEASERMMDLCKSAGWKVCELRNDTTA